MPDKWIVTDELIVRQWLTENKGLVFIGKIRLQNQC